LTEGQSYSINIQTSASNAQDTKVWIDFNNDGTFTQANELVFSSLNTINPTGNINIPTGASTLNKVLRMRVSSDNGGSNPSSCTALIRGQAEDYGVTIQQFVGTEEFTIYNLQFTIYPNPFSESATLRITNPLITNYGLKIYNVFGQDVYNKIIRNSPFVISRGDLPDGIYIYEIMGVDGVIGKGKLIIE
ncbi:MAG: GEVED domain-containing protein, partial [Bacteroidota bacterium]